MISGLEVYFGQFFELDGWQSKTGFYSMNFDIFNIYEECIIAYAEVIQAGEEEDWTGEMSRERARRRDLRD